MLALLLAAGAVSAQGQRRAAGPLEGKADSVVDGDTLWFVAADGGQRLQVRLLDIDAPEICQEWGAQARQALIDLVAGKPLRLRTGARDKAGRTLGRIEVEGLDASKRMVVEGHAWSTRTRWDRGPLVAEERTAATLKRGMHAAGNAEPPDKFRARQGDCPSAPAPSVPSAATAAPKR
jgi:endonuclease YncB( thermonuclease family)